MLCDHQLVSSPRHPRHDTRHDTRLFEVREAFKCTVLLGFSAHISAYIAKKTPRRPGVSRGGLPALPAEGLRACASPVAVPATDAGPLVNAG